jgi:hypothetical protein
MVKRAAAAPRDGAASVAPGPERLDDGQVFALAGRYEKAQRLEGRAKQLKQDFAGRIVAELDQRKLSRLEAPDGSGVTVVRNESWDADGLYRRCPSPLRETLFRESHDLNALPEAVRARIVARLHPGQRAAIARQELDTAALAAARVEKKIGERVLRPCRKLGSPYIRVSHGGPRKVAVPRRGRP